MSLTRLEKVNAIAGALWETSLSDDVKTMAEDVLAELERQNYRIIKRRYNK